MLQSIHRFFRQNASSLSIVTYLLLMPSLLIPLHKTFSQSYQSGSSMDAFAKAGNALKAGLARPEASDSEKDTTSRTTSNKNLTPIIKANKAPNPLSQLAAFQPLQQRPRSIKAKQKKVAKTSPKSSEIKQAVKSKRTPTTSSEENNRVQELKRELQKTKEQLAIAELEVSRLSAILQSSSRARISPSRPAEISRQKVPQQGVALKTSSTYNTKTADTAPANDMQVATIASKKAYLRLGPGKQHSTLMALREGSRLAVEMRQGDWYRVFAPNGQRAWIHSSVLSFGDGSHRLNDGSSITTRGIVRDQR